MSQFALGISCFSLGFVIAQALYMRLIERGRRREDSYREMLSRSYARNRETHKMLSAARRGH